VLGAELLDLALLEVGVDLDLVDRRHDLRLLQQRGEVVDHEGNTPRPRAGIVMSLLRVTFVMGSTLGRRSGSWQGLS
jgi:hypothetical protein